MMLVVLVISVTGLSPRVRGNPGRAPAVSRRAGSIPACAGEPNSSATLDAMVNGLSPRVRGNLLANTGRYGISPGLSPRVRGNHH